MFENIAMAFSAIRANKTRSFLTMLGIIIGIGSVIAIVSIGDSMRGLMTDLYKEVGINRVVTYISYEVEEYRMSDYFTIDDLEQIQEAFPEEIAYLDFQSSDSQDAIYGRNRLKIYYTGINSGYDKVQPVNIIHGRMINEDDVQNRKKNIVLEKNTAIQLFGTDDVVGRSFRSSINKDLDDYYVVGVYEKSMSAFAALMMGTGGDGEAYAPYTLMVDPDTWNFSLNFYVADGVDQSILQPKFVRYLAKMKDRSENLITYYSAKDEMGQWDTILASLSVAVGAIAAISLLVGGIGIMNIMLVSVTERTREIGIRKALGARTRDVLMQFLTESAIISAFGGVIGVLLGVGLVSLGGAALGVAVVVRPSVVLLAVSFSAVVGIFFGLYPASKAAKADPIDALRYE
ncbi:MAG: ABC transporter permease [bacterium]|nr:ABC transporter permease [bacterium]